MIRQNISLHYYQNQQTLTPILQLALQSSKRKPKQSINPTLREEEHTDG